jgi:hypothetical protein
MKAEKQYRQIRKKEEEDHPPPLSPESADQLPVQKETGNRPHQKGSGEQQQRNAAVIRDALLIYQWNGKDPHSRLGCHEKYQLSQRNHDAGCPASAQIAKIGRVNSRKKCPPLFRVQLRENAAQANRKTNLQNSIDKQSLDQDLIYPFSKPQMVSGIFTCQKKELLHLPPGQCFPKPIFQQL